MKTFCSALSLSLTVEMSTGHFFILVLLGCGLLGMPTPSTKLSLKGLNPCFVDEGASSGWSDRARPRGRPRILPCREYLHDTLFHLMVWRNPCFVGMWSFRGKKNDDGEKEIVS